jgi:hypothetical protein
LDAYRGCLGRYAPNLEEADMPNSASLAVLTLRTAQRQVSHGPMMPRLWDAMRSEWQRMQDRAIAQSVRKLDHEGVNEDYRMACRSTFR